MSDPVAGLISGVLNAGLGIYSTEKQGQFMEKQLRSQERLAKEQLKRESQQDVFERLDKRMDFRMEQEKDIRDSQNDQKNQDKNLITIALVAGILLVFGIFGMVFMLKKN